MKEFTIGRNEECDFVIHNKSVSGKHAYIKVSEDYKRTFLKDLDSTNGSFVDNNQIVNKEITKKSNIKLGDYELNVLYLFKKLEEYIHENKIDFSKEFNKLKEVESQYKKKKGNLKKNYQLKSIGIRLGGTLLILIVLYFSKIVEVEMLSRIGFILFSLVGLLSFFVPIDKKIDTLNDELFVKYSQEFVCPKCYRELIGKSFNYWKAKKKCPRCKCDWVKDQNE